MTLADAGPPGSGRAIADAVTALGHDPAAVRRVVLTHFHEDVAGGAAEPAALTGARVLAHAADAAVLRREVPAPEPVLEERERPLHAAALRHLPVREVEPPARIGE
ncbi:MBL fold metallo-hydrolase [Streptomyces bobili]|uniref:MBL fold metallo-hydrolase n=1 Tax=Streptomyces bobili TaxID=67280 RepID=UPI003F6416BF